MTEPQRNILVVAHARREDTVEAADRVINALRDAGARPVLAPDDALELAEALPELAGIARLGIEVPVHDIELAIVLGGDGTILRATELVRDGSAPVLGINMGHVGFLAESERDDMDDAVRRVIARDYRVEERLALQVRVKDSADAVLYETWALNEATVEKASRERMLEVVMEVDGRPLSSFGCDGVVVSTPTGSTAYNFSAGGPVIWPTVEAIAVVPLSAHALFAKPLVVGPEHSVAIEVLERTNGTGILWCDGRRSHELPPGARVVVRRSERPVLLARLHPAAFTDRLVRKFRLPIGGWRGPVTINDGSGYSRRDDGGLGSEMEPEPDE
jgi:NAD+ kinase